MRLSILALAIVIFGATDASAQTSSTCRTADADGIPLTYTTAAGDIESQVAFRFSVVDMRSANRPLTGGEGSWYDLKDAPSGELVPGQTISLALNRPINK